MTRARPLAPEDRQAQLLAAARSEFARQGYHNTAVSDIIAAAGVARGTFYNYFESKRAIFQSVLDDLMDGVYAAADPIDVTRPIPPQVRAMLVSIVEVLTDPGVTRLLMTEAVGIDEQGDAAVSAFYRASAVRLQAALEVGQGMGVVAPGDMATTSKCLIGMVKEPIFQAALSGEPLEAEPFVDLLFGLLAHGVLVGAR